MERERNYVSLVYVCTRVGLYVRVCVCVCWWAPLKDKIIQYE